VVGLAERLLRDLPVRVDELRGVRLDAQVLEPPALELRAQVRDPLVERLTVAIRVEEDEAAPAAHGQRRQRELRILDVPEVPARRHVLQLAVERPAEAMERAAQLRGAAVVFLQESSAMEAGIGIRLHVARGRAHHEERHARDVVAVVVAGLRDLLLAAGVLPDALPEELHLLVEPLLRDEALVRDVLVAEVHGGLQAQNRGDRVCVRVEQLLIGHAGRARHRGGIERVRSLLQAGLLEGRVEGATSGRAQDLFRGGEE
jgi:hypothetical protein